MSAPRYLKLRGSVCWFQIGVPADLQARYGKKHVQENLRTSDRSVAALMAQSRAVHWKREFSPDIETLREARTPRQAYLEALRQIAASYVENESDVDAVTVGKTIGSRAR